MSCLRRPVAPLLSLALFALVTALTPAPASAGGGPRNVLVVVNESSPEALEIAARYIEARGIPASNVCRIRTSSALTVSEAVYRDEIETPVLDCLAASPHADRLDYLVLTRGLPVRANIPDSSAPPTKPASITALLQVMTTSMQGKEQEYGPPYGFANHPNTYRNRREWFSHQTSYGSFQIYLATMLSGYWSEDAIALIDRSVASDLAPPTDVVDAAFYYEETTDPGSPANPRNASIPDAVAWMTTRGYPAVHVAGSDPDVTDSVVASHLNAGTYSSISRAEIESNTFPPGALVDVLESFGLTPPNFDPDDPGQQVPVTWWVTAGVTGAQGTVAEPYSIAFPDAHLLEPYVEGFNLAETFYQGIPYFYWMNLVLGDPLCAPYAMPPVVTITNPGGGATVRGPLVRIDASATTARPEGILSVELLIDDQVVWSDVGAAVAALWDSRTVTDGWHRLEALAYENTDVRTQGWAAIDLFVDNAGLTLSIAAPADGEVVTDGFVATVSGSPALNAVTLSAGGTVVGTATGAPPWDVTVDGSLLGRGRHLLEAVATDGARSVRARPVSFQLVVPPRLHDLAPPDGPTAGGTTVLIRGWAFEPDVRVFFGAAEAASVNRIDANHLEAVTPPGPPRAVDVTVENGAGPSLVIPGGFTYLGTGCAVTEPATDLRVAREPDGRVTMTWAPSTDACLFGYRVFSIVDPPAPPSVFPDDWGDRTVDDEDGAPGGDAAWLAPPSVGGRLELFQVALEGADGGVGPR